MRTDIFEVDHIVETRHELVQQLIQKEVNSYYETEAIAHCRRGTILWVIRKTTAKQPMIKLDAGQSVNRIEIFRLVKSKFNTSLKWGYLAFNEDRPYSIKCPLKYLELASETNPKWRERVREYHQQRKLKRR